MIILFIYFFNRFEKLIRKYPGLADELNEMQNSSFFVPTNKAFTSEVDDLLEGENKLPEEAVVSLIKYHITSHRLYSCDFNNNQQVETGIEEKSRINLYSTVSILLIIKTQFTKIIR